MAIDYERHAKIYKAFCDENRLRILELLQTGEKCGCNLEEALPISQSTLSHHMKILVESGIVAVRREGKWSYYALSDEGGKEALNFLEKWLTKAYDANDKCQCKI